MKRPKMTMNEVIADMRERGLRISQPRFIKCIEMGIFPFVKVINLGGNCKNSFLIFRKDYEDWAKDYLGGYEV